MEYKKIKSYTYTELELRQIWIETYCRAPISTFDGIEVSFYSEMFDHAFFESANHQLKDNQYYPLIVVRKCYGLKIHFKIRQLY